MVLVEGTGTRVEPDDDEAQAFADQAGFDPRLSAGYAFLRITPHLVQAWREADELRGRDLMKDGHWLVEHGPRRPLSPAPHERRAVAISPSIAAPMAGSTSWRARSQARTADAAATLCR